MIAVIFPGQGSQYVGMADVLLENFPWTSEIFEEGSDAIKENLLELCKNGPEDQLRLTQNGQPCILSTSYAWFQVLSREFGFVPSAGAGHSLGEYTALLAAGSMKLPEAVRLVRKRGELMQNAVPVGHGKMTAVLGLADDTVQDLCKLASAGEESLVVAVNFNAPNQVVVAGHTAAVERLENLANEPGDYKARKLVPLNVSAPFHSPLMNPVVGEFRPYLESVDWQQPQFPIAMNVDGKVHEDPHILDKLSEQLDHAVKWTSCVRSLFEAGKKFFVEPGPGKVLTGLNKRIERSAKTFSVDSMEDLKKFEQWMQEVKS